jgi:hypothetical protein
MDVGLEQSDYHDRRCVQTSLGLVLEVIFEYHKSRLSCATPEIPELFPSEQVSVPHEG